MIHLLGLKIIGETSSHIAWHERKKCCDLHEDMMDYDGLCHQDSPTTYAWQPITAMEIPGKINGGVLWENSSRWMVDVPARHVLITGRCVQQRNDDSKWIQPGDIRNIVEIEWR